MAKLTLMTTRTTASTLKPAPCKEDTMFCKNLNSEKLDDIVARLVRMESRLCQFMIHQGADPYAKPPASPQSARQSAYQRGATSGS